LGAFYGGSISGGVTWDSQGNIALYKTTSDGGTIGAVAGISVGSSVTNATTISQTEGPGKNVGVDIDVLGGGGADIPMGANKEYSGVGVSIGGGIGVDGHIERTNTSLHYNANVFDEADRVSHNVSRWGSDVKAGIKHNFCKATGWSGSRYGSYVGC
jgi:hypothetical protein